MQSYLGNQEPELDYVTQRPSITKQDWPEKMKKVNKRFLMILCHIHRSSKCKKSFLWQELGKNAENPKPDITTNMSKLKVSIEALSSQLRESHGRRGRVIVRIRVNEGHSNLHSFNYVFILKHQGCICLYILTIPLLPFILCPGLNFVLLLLFPNYPVANTLRRIFSNMFL